MSRMRTATTIRLALAGTRTDAARVVLTALAAAGVTLGLLCVATVLSIPATPQVDGMTTYAPYTNELLAEPGLRPGLAATLVLLTLPLLVFVAQCARLGAPARDRRLAGYRMAGATPADTVRIAAAEGGVASLIGTALGTAAYFVGRVLADAPDPYGRRALPTNVLPPAWGIALAVLAVPVLTVLLSTLLLRRVTMSPFGLVRRVRAQRPPLWPALALLVGVGFLSVGGTVLSWCTPTDNAPPGHLILAFFGLEAVAVVLVVVGLAFGTSWLTRTMGVLVNRYARRPAVILGANRAASDPWLGSRTITVLFVATMFAAGCAVLRNGFAIANVAWARLGRMESHYTHQNPGYADVSFYARAFDLITLAMQLTLGVAIAGLLVALIENIVSRRRILAATVAAGMPRTTLAGALTIQVLLATAPGLLVAAAVGAAAGWGFSPGATVSQPAMAVCVPSGARNACPPHQPGHLVHVPHLTTHLTTPIPYLHLTTIFALSLAAVLLTIALSLPFLHPTTHPQNLRTE